MTGCSRRVEIDFYTQHFIAFDLSGDENSKKLYTLRPRFGAQKPFPRAINLTFISNVIFSSGTCIGRHVFPSISKYFVPKPQGVITHANTVGMRGKTLQPKYGYQREVECVVLAHAYPSHQSIRANISTHRLWTRRGLGGSSGGRIQTTNRQQSHFPTMGGKDDDDDRFCCQSSGTCTELERYTGRKCAVELRWMSIFDCLVIFLKIITANFLTILFN